MRLEGWGGPMVRDALLRSAPHHEARLGLPISPLQRWRGRAHGVSASHLIPLIPAQAGIQLVGPRLRGDERRELAISPSLAGLVPAIHVSPVMKRLKTRMPATRAGMTDHGEPSPTVVPTQADPGQSGSGSAIQRCRGTPQAQWETHARPPIRRRAAEESVPTRNLLECRLKEVA